MTDSTVTWTKPAWFNRVARRYVLKQLARLKQGRIVWRDGNAQTLYFGKPEQKAGLQASVQILDPRFYRAVLLGSDVGLGQAYMDGWFECDDVVALLRILLANEEAYQSVDRGTAWLMQCIGRIRYFFERNSKSNSTRNIAAHYDLSNAFYACWLDATMMYSSAVFTNDASTLDEGVRHKYQAIGEQLQLTPEHHVLEIGTGWGGLAKHLAEQFGCRVTTTTISQAQFEYAQSLFEQAGLTEQITLLQQDYRELSGQYDAVVSIEMIEAVGHQYLDTYLAQCDQLLKPAGDLFLQAIVVPDERYNATKRAMDYIRRYIFPGGFLPSVKVIQDKLLKYSGLHCQSLKRIGQDYARTLAIWNARFEQQQSQILALGFDQRFMRMWQFYFWFCQAGFLADHIDCVQLHFKRA